MTRDEQIDVLKGLLARVRLTAQARGIELPQGQPRGAVDATETAAFERTSAAPLSIEHGADDLEPFVAAAPEAPPVEHRNGSALTTFVETGSGTHAPLALVGAPPAEVGSSGAMPARASAPAGALTSPPGLVDDDDDDDDNLPRTAVSISFAADSPYASPQAPPLQPPPSRQPFDAAFEDEITSNGDPAEIEAAVLASAEPAIPAPPPTPPPITRVPSVNADLWADAHADPRSDGVPPAPPTRVMTPVPPAAPTRVVTPSAPPQRASSLPAVPLTLDDLDLDGLGTPEAAISVPPPRATSHMPPSRISHPPVMAVPPPAHVPTPPPPRVPTPPPAYIPTPPPPRVPMPPPAYIPTPPPPRVPTPPPHLATPVPAYVPTPLPPAMVAARADAEDVELDEGDLLESVPPSGSSAQGGAPDPTATLPGSASFAAGFEGRASGGDLEEEVPASQRQMRMEDRPLDDALEGISEPPPESGEVESQRYAKSSEEIEQTTEVRALASVDVVDRPPVDLGPVAVATFSGSLASSRRPSFGEILDSALDL